MKNTKLENVKQHLIHICKQEDITLSQALRYIIYSEYPIGTIDELGGDDKETIQELKEDYNLLWDLQPTIEDDEEHAFAIQHARDIYDILIGDDSYED
jgi:hypothetical protein